MTDITKRLEKLSSRLVVSMDSPGAHSALEAAEEIRTLRSRLHSAEMAIRWMNRYNRAGPDALEWIKAAGIELAKDEVVEKRVPTCPRCHHELPLHEQHCTRV